MAVGIDAGQVLDEADVALSGPEEDRGEGDRGAVHALEPHADAEHVEIDGSAAGGAVADFVVAIPAGLGASGTPFLVRSRSLVFEHVKRRQAPVRLSKAT